MVAVGIQEPDRVTREVVREHLDANAAIHVIWSVASAGDALARLGEVETDVVLASARHAGTSDFARRVRSLPGRPDMVVWGVDEAPASTVRLVEAGATGCVGRGEPPDELTGLVLAVTRNRSEFSPETGYRLARRVAELASLCEGGGLDVGRLARLTPREREVLELLGSRLSNRQIADRLVVEVSTVKTHVHHILQKLGVRSRHQAARFLVLEQREGEHRTK